MRLILLSLAVMLAGFLMLIIGSVMIDKEKQPVFGLRLATVGWVLVLIVVYGWVLFGQMHHLYSFPIPRNR